MIRGEIATAYMKTGTPNLASGCLYTVWLAFGTPHTLGRLAGHTFANATEAYQYTTKRHTDRNPPPGVPVWFGSTAGPRYAGDTHWPDGDVAVSVGGGWLTATDYPTFGHIGRCTIAQREAQTGRVYLGWTEDFLGNDIIFAGPSPAAPAAPTAAPPVPITLKRSKHMMTVRDSQTGTISTLVEGAPGYNYANMDEYNEVVDMIAMHNGLTPPEYRVPQPPDIRGLTSEQLGKVMLEVDTPRFVLLKHVFAGS